jgi:hypothetical protein
VNFNKIILVLFAGYFLVAGIGAFQRIAHGKAAATPQGNTVTLTVHDAAGRVFYVTAQRIEPPFVYDNGNISLTLQSDELLCSGFGVRQ